MLLVTCYSGTVVYIEENSIVYVFVSQLLFHSCDQRDLSHALFDFN